MRYTTMGRTGVQVSAVGLGGNVFGSAVDEAGASAIIDRATELRINFLDTAESYTAGRSVEILGKALGGRRDAFVLATKVGSNHTEGLEAGGRLTRKRIVERAVKIAAGVIKDPSYLPVIYAAGEDDDWEDPRTWRAANPSYEALGIAFQDDLAHQAKRTASFEKVFQRIKRASGLVEFHAHLLRHTWATNFMRQPASSLLELKRQGGWTRWKQVERYSHAVPMTDRRALPNPLAIGKTRVQKSAFGQPPSTRVSRLEVAG